MGRKVAGAAAAMIAVVLSVVLVGGQVGSGGFLWWGNHEPIYIYGNSGFTVENGVFSGTGTAEDPYIIEGWRVDRPDADYGIYVDHTTAYFVIRDCVVEGTRIAGIYFNTVQNGRVEDTQIALSDTAIHLLDSSNNTFERNVLAENKIGLATAATSRDNVITGNTFLDNGINGHDPNRWNRWYDNGVGNYWSDYTGYDNDGDGIGDLPYYKLYDRYPLMSEPVAWTRVASAGLTYAGNQVSPSGALVVSSSTPITLSSLDLGSGLSEIRYAIDGGDWSVYGGPIYLTGEDGPQKLSYYGIDHLGNVESESTISFVLDNHPPITEIVIGEPKYEDDRGIWITSKSQITLNLVQQSTYGTTQTFYRIDGRGWQQYSRPFTVAGSDGTHQITYYSRNASGVTEDMKTMTVIKDDAPPSTRGAQTSAPASEIQVNIGTPTESDVEDPVEEEVSVVVEEPDPVEEEPAPVAEQEPATSEEKGATSAEAADVMESSADAETATIDVTVDADVQTPSAPM